MLREITLADLDRLEELEKVCFLKSPWSKNMLKESIVYGDKYKICYEHNGKIVAYLIASYNSWDAEIYTLGVDLSYRRQGLARQLISNLKDFCVLNKIESIFLEVRESNVSAQKLYLSFGFKQIAIRKKYYEDTEDALIMEYKISES